MTYSAGGLFRRLDKTLSSTPRCRLSDLSRMLQVDRHTLEKAVVQSIGMTFRQYQNSKIIACFRRFLAQGTCLTQKEIAFRLGYAHSTSFSRFLKRHADQSSASLKDIPENLDKTP